MFAQVFRALGPTVLRTAIQGNLANRPSVQFAGDNMNNMNNENANDSDDVIIEFEPEPLDEDTSSESPSSPLVGPDSSQSSTVEALTDNEISSDKRH